MRTGYLGVLLLAAGGAATAWLFPTSANAQAAAKSAKTPTKAKNNYKPPRFEKGKTADLQGVWIVDAWDTSRYSLEWHNGATGIRPGKGSIVDPADGLIPYTPAARQKQQENLKKHLTDDPMAKCYMTGVPRFVTSGFPFQIIQTPKYIILASEYTHMIRYVYMDRTDHTYEGGTDFWNGDSIGKWEGDTLVVETWSNNNQTWFDMSGSHHSDKLRVTERFMRTSLDTMDYTATITDPEVLTRPFTINITLHRNTDKYAQLMEYECHVYSEEDKGTAGGQATSF
jgi:hypothetical protein